MKTLLTIIAVLASLALIFSVIALIMAFNVASLADTQVTVDLVVSVAKMYLIG